MKNFDEIFENDEKDQFPDDDIEIKIPVNGHLNSTSKKPNGQTTFDNSHAQHLQPDQPTNKNPKSLDQNKKVSF
eukprot:CAMPEP_0116882354 /NCGR_PEP_ID=MMETSP0463-20121206/14567_1 /TAXON_ID=181622 /ORGANISM="Strombidinopsis sp, Strain SopsisLIS2011" /LENGTH=73 /DNA_ID=CAMNT_0004535417 /DNA_START=2857 /DNA_END=3078 /DNA_ORIENTATION=-